MALVSDAITDSLIRMGVLAAGETPSAADMTYGFSTLNMLMDSWATERLTIPYIARATATLTANQASFTVGTGGDINIVRPTFISGIRFIDTSQDPDLEMPLSILTDDAYAAIALKALTSTLPAAAYYRPTYASGFGTLIPWPIPTSTTLQWALYYPVQMPQLAATTSTLAIPPGYHRFFVTQLAAEMIPAFRVPDDIAGPIYAQAREAKEQVKNANFRMSDLAMDPAVLGTARHSTYSQFLSGP